MYYFIVNPKASSGKGMEIWNTLEAELKHRKIAYKAYFTRHKTHAIELAQAISEKYSPCTIVAVGGDGTVNEVMNGLTNLEQITFGYVPSGSGNDLARGLKLPTEPLEALNAILAPTRFHQMSIGRNRSHENYRNFAVSTGIGFDAAVARQALDSKLKNFLNKFKLGKLIYTFIALKQLMTMRFCDMDVILDDDITHTFRRVYFAAIMNLPYEGGGFKFCPEAASDDDYLDICIVANLPRLKALCLLPTAFKGGHVRFKGVHILRCKKVHIRTGSKLTVHTDGEFFGMLKEIEVSLYEKKLSFIVG